jgi:hypothetical protein
VVRHDNLSTKTWVWIPGLSIIFDFFLCAAGQDGWGMTDGYCLVQAARALVRPAKPWRNWPRHGQRLLPGVADRGGCSQLGPWRSLGTTGRGCGAAATWHGRLRSPGAVAWLAVAGPLHSTADQCSADRSRSWPVAKPSTKVLTAKEKQKFVCNVVVTVV